MVSVAGLWRWPQKTRSRADQQPTNPANGWTDTVLAEWTIPQAQFLAGDLTLPKVSAVSLAVSYCCCCSPYAAATETQQPEKAPAISAGTTAGT